MSPSYQHSPSKCHQAIGASVSNAGQGLRGRSAGAVGSISHITPSQPGPQCTSGSLEAEPERGAWKGRREMGKVVSRASKSGRLGHGGGRWVGNRVWGPGIPSQMQGLLGPRWRPTPTVTVILGRCLPCSPGRGRVLMTVLHLLRPLGSPLSLSCRPCPCPASWIRLNTDAQIKPPSATYLPAVWPVRASVPSPVKWENSASHRHYEHADPWPGHHIRTFQHSQVPRGRPPAPCRPTRAQQPQDKRTYVPKCTHTRGSSLYTGRLSPWSLASCPCPAHMLRVLLKFPENPRSFNRVLRGPSEEWSTGRGVGWGGVGKAALCPCFPRPLGE